ncbi:cation channel sperm-associated protein 2 [Alligator mississippiensis]|uniref:cation channel sperm-associated protein 2 n=1 Tax=Alligator mississippiensis TaxID=8496 RepID=UPI002877D335|nr:cation channel sperm-associated protein 2 [Alligator mississippiensis]XP_059570425.1 cation channel sperm-associated protein 2 [Alligator mississippiensis]
MDPPQVTAVARPPQCSCSVSCTAPRVLQPGTRAPSPQPRCSPHLALSCLDPVPGWAPAASLPRMCHARATAGGQRGRRVSARSGCSPDTLLLQSPEDAPKDKGPASFTLLPRADAIRSKLIYTFYLVDHLQGLCQAVPRHNIRDFLDHKKRKKLMLADHHQLIRFNIALVRNSGVPRGQRLCSRLHVRCSRWPPLAMWASWLLSGTIFKSFIIILIFLNTVILMIKSEMMNWTGESIRNLMLSLEVLTWFIIAIFILEIGLSWVVDFRGYWHNIWNIFDFSITVLSLVPEFLYLLPVADWEVRRRLLRIGRVSLSLKLFSRFRQVRLIVLAIMKALKAMTFILLLLLIFFYVFTVSGIFFFESYSRSDRTDLEYGWYFRDLPNSLVTVFILFTMDHWYSLLQDTWKIPEINKVISSLYIILWLLIGSFIFRNIFVAIMVTNFKNIRSDLIEEVKQIETQKRADLFKMQIREKRQSQSHVLGGSLESSSSTRRLHFSCLEPEKELASELSPPTSSSDQRSSKDLDWETYVHQNLESLREGGEGEQVMWPRDSLFRYFELLEQLQYNLEERRRLQEYAVRALTNMQDK